MRLQSFVEAPFESAQSGVFVADRADQRRREGPGRILAHQLRREPDTAQRAGAHHFDLPRLEVIVDDDVATLRHDAQPLRDRAIDRRGIKVEQFREIERDRLRLGARLRIDEESVAEHARRNHTAAPIEQIAASRVFDAAREAAIHVFRERVVRPLLQLNDAGEDDHETDDHETEEDAAQLPRAVELPAFHVIGRLERQAAPPFSGQG